MFYYWFQISNLSTKKPLSTEKNKEKVLMTKFSGQFIFILQPVETFLLKWRVKVDGRKTCSSIGQLLYKWMALHLKWSHIKAK